jgi:hypothetical protein
MKTIKLLAVFIFLLSSTIFSQNLWKNEILLDFIVQYNTKASAFVDVNGIHIVYWRNGGIRYALVNSQGNIIKYDKVIETESSGADLANVVAFDNDVYAIYFKNNKIQVARSTNLGDNWNNNFSDRPLVNTGCNKILAYKQPGSDFMNITWAELRVGSTVDYDVHYIRFVPNAQPPSWTAYQRVSEDDPWG